MLIPSEIAQIPAVQKHGGLIGIRRNRDALLDLDDSVSRFKFGSTGAMHNFDLSQRLEYEFGIGRIVGRRGAQRRERRVVEYPTDIWQDIIWIDHPACGRQQCGHQNRQNRQGSSRLPCCRLRHAVFTCPLRCGHLGSTFHRQDPGVFVRGHGPHGALTGDATVPEWKSAARWRSTTAAINSRIAVASLSTPDISAMRPWMQVRWPKVT